MLLCWIDLETTGLNQVRDNFREVAWQAATLDDPFYCFSGGSGVIGYDITEAALANISNAEKCRDWLVANWSRLPGTVEE